MSDYSPISFDGRYFGPIPEPRSRASCGRSGRGEGLPIPAIVLKIGSLVEVHGYHFYELHDFFLTAIVTKIEEPFSEAVTQWVCRSIREDCRELSVALYRVAIGAQPLQVFEVVFPSRRCIHDACDGHDHRITGVSPCL
jgi:hypothetical protein